MELKDIKKGLSLNEHAQIDSATEGSVAGSISYSDEDAFPDEEDIVFPDEEAKKATEKAMALLLHKDRTAWELKDRLYRAGFSEKAGEFAFEYVSKYGYINDLRYATRYIDFHKTSKSRNVIRRKLKEKGVTEDIITEAFLSYADTGDAMDDSNTADPEVIALRSLIKKRLKGREVSELTYEEKQKQMRYLAGKGFPTEMIRREFR